MGFRFGSVCSGIESASVAWEPLGFEAAWFAEIEPFPSAVLAHRWPNVPNLGDMTTIADRVLAGEVEAPDALVGGTPCQAFSVAGLRQSLADARGNLTQSFVELADAIDSVRLAAGKPPAFILWENVPGVFSVSDNAFGCFLGGLVGSDSPIVPAGGGGWTDAGVADGPARRAAWRILDAQHFALAQRRERVFVLARGGAGDWSAADALLPVIESVRWHPAPSRATRQGVAGPLGAGAKGRGWSDDLERSGAFVPEVSPTVSAKWSKGTGGPSGDEAQNLIPVVAGTINAGAHPGGYNGQDAHNDLLIPVTHALTAEGFDASEDGTGCGTPLVPQLVPFDETQITHPENRSRPKPGDPSPTLSKGARPPAIAFTSKDSGQDAGELSPTLRAGEGERQNGGVMPAVAIPAQSVNKRRDDKKNGIGIAGDGDPQFTLTAEDRHGVAFSITPESGAAAGCGAVEVANALTSVSESSKNQRGTHVAEQWRVRRLTPKECERLQGFHDDFTLIPNFRGKWAKDSPRYRALGNSMAVNVMRYLGQRIQAVLS